MALFAMLSPLFIAALLSPAGKGLTSRNSAELAKAVLIGHKPSDMTTNYIFLLFRSEKAWVSLQQIEGNPLFKKCVKLDVLCD